MNFLLRPKSTEQGLTLLESLIALVVMSLAVAAMAHPMIMASATRLQNQKAEQALALAQAEVDRVRLLAERGDLTLAQLNQQLPPDAGSVNPNTVGAPISSTPSSLAACTTDRTQLTVTSWCSQDLDGNGSADLGVQTFRAKVQTSATDQIPVFFQMGVRVYTSQTLARYAGTPDLTTQTGNLKQTTGDSFTQKPLVVIYTPIIRSDYTNAQGSSLKEYCLALPAGTTATCPSN